jgi:hypothetical protein
MSSTKIQDESHQEALHYCQGMIRDFDRFQSVVMLMETAVLAETAKTEGSGDMVESWVAEAFARNVSWLLDKMDESVRDTRAALMAGGFDMGRRI